MAENEETTDQSQKTEEPTQRRLDDARKRGQVVMSREVNNWVILFAGAIMIMALGPGLLADLRDMLTGFLVAPHQFNATPGGLGALFTSIMKQLAAILFLPALLLFVAAILGPFVQIGPLFTPEPLKPKLENISPIRGMQRLFSLRAIAEFLKSLFKLMLVGGVGILMLLPFYGNVEHFINIETQVMLFELQSIALRLFAGVLAVLFVIAILDYIYQRFEFMKKMRMSRQEIREEFKQTEGDPQIKARLRELRMTRARQRMMQAVPEADVVITNPTHFAVALKYEPREMDAPVMVAKGVDRVAEKIREVAKENNVAIVENPPLARALHASMEIDEMIPGEHFQAVAEIISYVFKLKNKPMH